MHYIEVNYLTLDRTVVFCRHLHFSPLLLLLLLLFALALARERLVGLFVCLCFQHWYVPLFGCRLARSSGGGGGKRKWQKLVDGGNVWGQLGEFVINCGLASPSPPNILIPGSQAPSLAQANSLAEKPAANSLFSFLAALIGTSDSSGAEGGPAAYSLSSRQSPRTPLHSWSTKCTADTR